MPSITSRSLTSGIESKNFWISGSISKPSSELDSCFFSSIKTWISSIIDEIPILCVIAAYAKGRTVIEGVGELKIKESNRVKAILVNIDNMGGMAELIRDSLIITPKNKLHNTTINSFSDHRIFMTFYIANLVSRGNFNKSLIDSCYKKSFIDFFDILEEIIKWKNSI